MAPSFDVAVVGLGAMGSATLYQLAKRRADVLLSYVRPVFGERRQQLVWTARALAQEVVLHCRRP